MIQTAAVLGGGAVARRSRGLPGAGVRVLASAPRQRSQPPPLRDGGHRALPSRISPSPSLRDHVDRGSSRPPRRRAGVSRRSFPLAAACADRIVPILCVRSPATGTRVRVVSPPHLRIPMRAKGRPGAARGPPGNDAALTNRPSRVRSITPRGARGRRQVASSPKRCARSARPQGSPTASPRRLLPACTRALEKCGTSRRTGESPAPLLGGPETVASHRKAPPRRAQALRSAHPRHRALRTHPAGAPRHGPSEPKIIGIHVVDDPRRAIGQLATARAVSPARTTATRPRTCRRR